MFGLKRQNLKEHSGIPRNERVSASLFVCFGVSEHSRLHQRSQEDLLYVMQSVLSVSQHPSFTFILVKGLHLTHVTVLGREAMARKPWDLQNFGFIE